MSLNSILTDIADAIREKTGSTASLKLEQMASAISGIQADLSDIGNLHFWRRYNGNPSNPYAEEEVTDVSLLVATTILNNTTYRSIYYGSSFTFDEEKGEFSLSPVGNSTTNVDTLKANIGEYPYIRYYTDYDYIYHVPSDAVITEYTSSSYGNARRINISKATKLVITAVCGYAASQESDTYPTDGEHTDGYWYVYGGLLADALSE